MRPPFRPCPRRRSKRVELLTQPLSILQVLRCQSAFFNRQFLAHSGLFFDQSLKCEADYRFIPLDAQIGTDQFQKMRGVTTVDVPFPRWSIAAGLSHLPNFLTVRSYGSPECRTQPIDHALVCVANSNAKSVTGIVKSSGFFYAVVEVNHDGAFSIQESGCVC